MAIIDENTQFDADSIDSKVVGIAAEVGSMTLACINTIKDSFCMLQKVA